MDKLERATTNENNETNESPFDILMTPPDSGMAEVADDSAEAEEPNRTLELYKNFLRLDMRIKEEMMDIAPDEQADSSEDSRMEYADDAYKTFRGMRLDFLQMARGFGEGNLIEEGVEDFFKRRNDVFAVSRYDYGTPGKIYRDAFSDLRGDFIEEVKDECAGYSLFKGNIARLLKDANTVNEALHAIHSYMMNDSNMLQSIPARRQEQLEENNPYDILSLRGDESKLGDEIFEEMRGQDVSSTDIVVIGDAQISMMIRGRGHAAMLEIMTAEEDPTKIAVHYNLPKLINRSKMSALPGVGKVTSNGVRGDFTIDRDGAAAKIREFILQIPTDADYVPDMSEPAVEERLQAEETPAELAPETELAEPSVEEHAAHGRRVFGRFFQKLKGR